MAKGLTPPREKPALSIILTDQSFYHTIVSDTEIYMLISLCNIEK